MKSPRRRSIVSNPAFRALLRANKARKTRGQAVVILGLSLVALMAFTGLALDGGSALAKRRTMQNAADAAAMAGAREVMVGSNQPTIYNRVNDYTTERNGASSFNANYYPGHQALSSGSGSAPSGATGVCVTSTVPYHTSFVSLVGVSSIDVTAQSCAIAHANCPGGGYAIWAQAGYNSSSCSKVVDWSGNGYRITGDVHSNGNVDMSGGNNSVNGRTEYVPNSGCNHCDTNGNNVAPTQSSSGSWPLYYNIADYAPAVPPSPEDPDGEPAGPIAQQAIDRGQYYEKPDGYHFTADDGDGLYWVEGDATWSVGGLTRRITIVTPSGIIMVSASNLNLTPYTSDGLLLFSDRQPPDNQLCNGPNINVSGSGSNWNGVIFSPLGQVAITGSSNSALSGSVIAWSVKLTGSDLALSYSDDYCPISVRTITAHLQKP